MIEVRRRSPNQLALGFAAGAALTALVLLVSSVLAQSPTPVPAPTPDAAQMLEWCRQMMASVNPQAMLEACRAMMGSMMSSVQGMMSGMCPMMGR